MTREEAIRAMQFYKEKLYNGIFNQYIDAFDMAISALRQQDQSPESVKMMPLTLAELRKMDGEPVWVCFSGAIVREDGWFIITETGKCEVLLNGKASVYKSFEYYGNTWLAYRQKPAEVSV